jgi:hypothetical protein
MKNGFYIFIIALMLCSCSDLMDGLEGAGGEVNMWKPLPPGMGEVDPNAPPIYKQGWRDGCETGMWVYGGDNYRYLGYKFKQDYSMINNEDYYSAWQDSYLYCRWYIWNYVKGGDIDIGFTPF